MFQGPGLAGARITDQRGRSDASTMVHQCQSLDNMVQGNRLGIDGRAASPEKEVRREFSMRYAADPAPSGALAEPVDTSWEAEAGYRRQPQPRLDHGSPHRLTAHNRGQRWRCCGAGGARFTALLVPGGHETQSDLRGLSRGGRYV